jgi:GGDEF domain-containing protein
MESFINSGKRNKSMAPEPNEQRIVITLDQLLLGVREKIGQIKDGLILAISEKAKRGTTDFGKDPFLVRGYFPTDYLLNSTSYVLKTLEDARHDPLIEGHDNSELRGKIIRQIEEIAREVFTIPKDMTWTGLVDLSEKSRRLYKEMLPIVEESRQIDHRTGLKISDYLTNYLFESLKQYLSQPNKHISIVYLDMNNFKLYNDIVKSHQADVAIQQTAALLKQLPEDVVVTRKNDKRGDEFMLFMHKDYDGASRIMNKMFIPQFDEKLPAMITAAMEKSAEKYDSNFDKMGGKLSFAIGISSTMLQDGTTIFARAKKRFGQTDEELSCELDYFNSCDLEKWHEKYDSLSPEVRKKILTALKGTLQDEAEDAAHWAKNLSKDRHNKELYERTVLKAYDPKLPESTYSYVGR